MLAPIRRAPKYLEYYSFTGKEVKRKEKDSVHKYNTILFKSC